jgi:predicted lipid-binding transport protein (Tim44 family)
MTQPGQPGSTIGQRAPTASPAGGFFNRPGFLGGMFAGFLGAGLLGMLFGHGFMGGLGGGFASMLGLMLQIGIVAIIGYLLWMWWQRRNQPALANGSSLRDANPGNSRSPMSFGNSGFGGAGFGNGVGLGGGSGAPASAARASGTDEVGLTPDDFNAFEKILADVQSAYSAEDLARLRREVTPEMLSYFSEDLAANASKGVVNRVSDVKLLQGDLAEAWRESDTDYATVAMRYSLNDQTVDRDSGRVVEGGPDEAAEVWTFLRARGGHWLVSAIQQT